MFEYKGYTIVISHVMNAQNRYTWSATRLTSVFSGDAPSYEQARENAKAAIDSSGVQPLYG